MREPVRARPPKRSAITEILQIDKRCKKVLLQKTLVLPILSLGFENLSSVTTRLELTYRLETIDIPYCISISSKISGTELSGHSQWRGGARLYTKIYRWRAQSRFVHANCRLKSADRKELCFC